MIHIVWVFSNTLRQSHEPKRSHISHGITRRTGTTLRIIVGICMLQHTAFGDTHLNAHTQKHFTSIVPSNNNHTKHTHTHTRNNTHTYALTDITTNIVMALNTIIC